MLRGLAFDPATRHFWAKDFSGPLIEFDSSGSIIRMFQDSLAAYGLAWDSWSPGGPFLWMWSQDGPAGGPYCLASQFDPRTGTRTGKQFLGVNFRSDSLTDIAGGATIVAGLETNTVALVALHQSTLDKVVVYRIGAMSTAHVGESEVGEVAESFSLGNNYPNPFNPVTTLPLFVASRSRVTVVVYDLLGARVKELANDEYPPGVYSLIWDGRNSSGDEASAGVYVASMRSDRGYSSLRKMILLR